LKTPNAIPAYTVPVSALIFRSAGLQVGVVDGNNKASLVSVTPGRDFGNEIEIITGLNAGDKVIINPPDSLIQGEDVQIVQPPAQNNGPQNQQASQPQQKPGGQGK
jgi:hypothetical protein